MFLVQNFFYKSSCKQTTIKYNTLMQYNTIQYNTIQYNTIPCNAWYEIESRDILKARINFTGSAKKA